MSEAQRYYSLSRYNQCPWFVRRKTSPGSRRSQETRPFAPSKVEALRNTISAVFQKKLTEEDITSLVAELQSGCYVVVTNGKMAYELG